MTYKKFIASLAKNAGMTTREAEALLKNYIGVLTADMCNQQSFPLVDFGYFEVKNKAEKKMFNPITQEYKTIPASKSMAFKPNPSLKNLLNK